MVETLDLGLLPPFLVRFLDMHTLTTERWPLPGFNYSTLIPSGTDTSLAEALSVRYPTGGLFRASLQTDRRTGVEHPRSGCEHSLNNPQLIY